MPQRECVRFSKESFLRTGNSRIWQMGCFTRLDTGCVASAMGAAEFHTRQWARFLSLLFRILQRVRLRCGMSDADMCPITTVMLSVGATGSDTTPPHRIKKRDCRATRCPKCKFRASCPNEQARDEYWVHNRKCTGSGCDYVHPCQTQLSAHETVLPNTPVRGTEVPVQVTTPQTVKRSRDDEASISQLESEIHRLRKRLSEEHVR